MDNKKLTNILVKDIVELDELIEDLKKNQQFEPVDIEYLHTRVKGIRQITEMLAKSPVQESHVSHAHYIPETQTVSAVITGDSRNKHLTEHEMPSGEKGVKAEDKVEGNVTPDKKGEVITGNDPLAGALWQADVKNEQISREEPVLKDKREEAFSPSGEGKEVLPRFDGTGKATGPVSSQPGPHPEPLSVKDEPKILGEKFVKEKSLNEVLSDPVKFESKLTNRPIGNLNSAIGINDRFLYVRELFAGDGNKFNEVVKLIDTFTSIHEAVEYLKENFRWKNSETSLKFLSLVKRRFSNE